MSNDKQCSTAAQAFRSVIKLVSENLVNFDLIKVKNFFKNNFGYS